MPGKSQILSRVAKSLFGDSPLVPKVVQEGRKVLGKEEGAHSFTMWPILAALRKLKGKDKVNGAIYDKWLKKVNNLDDRTGKLLAQHTGAKRIFAAKEVVPTTKKVKGLKAHAEYEGYKASAPVSKAMKIVTPMAAGMYLSDKLGGTHNQGKETGQNSKELMKQAADRIEHLQRRQEATKLAFAMVEKGRCEPFGTYAEFEEKVASLLDKDLKVVQEAIELDSGLTDFGKIASEGNAPVTVGLDGATDRFFAKLST